MQTGARRKWSELALTAAGFTAFFAAFFAPALVRAAFMASGDGLLQALPTFLGRHPLWEPNLMLGYPLFADPNQAYWYPLLRVLRHVPGAFNAYAVLPYAIAAFGSAGFARRATGSLPGAVVAGLTFALGGFMIAHQGHLNLTHPAAWSPYVLWAIEELRRRPRLPVAAGGALAFAMSATSGPQQSLVYIAAVGAAYALVFAPPRSQRLFFAQLGTMFPLGIALAAVALVPAAELAARSSRAGQTFVDFTAYAVTAGELPIRIAFPYFLGATASSAYPFSHANVAEPETTNYAGIVTLLLALVALRCGFERRQTIFWSATAVWALWMSLGDAAFAARLAYHVPVYGLFRIPGRHAFEFTFAVAMLAAFGAAAIERGRVRSRDLAFALIAGGGALAAALTFVAVRGNEVRAALAAAYGAPSGASTVVPASPLQNPALAVPCAVFAFGAFALVAWVRLPARRVAHALGVLVVAFDMSSFAWFAPWHGDGVAANIATPPPSAVRLRAMLEARGQRLLALLGASEPQSIPPNLSALWRVPALGGYVSLEDRRVAALLHMAPTGEVPATALSLGADRSLDLTATRFVLVPPPPAARVPESAEFSAPELDGFIGADAITPQKELVYGFPSPSEANALDLVSALGNAVDVPDGAHLADVTLTDSAGRSLAFPILAGRDTAESAYDRADVHALIRHARARVFGGTPDAHLYVARFRLPAPRRIARVTIRWRYAAKASALTVERVALVDERAHVAYNVGVDPAHWRDAGTSGADAVIENVRAMPGAWAVSRVTALDDVAQLRAIAAPAGAPLDVAREALVADKAHAFSGGNRDTAVAVLDDAPTASRYRVDCSARCLLIVDGLEYPGWRAAIDGARAPVVRADYLLRAVDVGPGRHEVAMWFAPRSLALGGTISLCALIAIVVILGAPFARKRSPAREDRRAHQKSHA